jgi:hypothetical protein
MYSFQKFLVSCLYSMLILGMGSETGGISLLSENRFHCLLISITFSLIAVIPKEKFYLIIIFL